MDVMSVTRRSNILPEEQKKESKRLYARERARRLRQDPAYRALELERNARWRRDNPDKVKDSRSRSHRKWYLVHKEEKLASNDAWKQKHPERVNELAREKRARDPETVRRITRISERKRRALKNQVPVGPEAGYYEEILRDDPCAYCGRPCEHIDHIVPLISGGEHDWTNFAPACQHCNQVKHAKSLLEFLCVLQTS